MSGTVIRWGFLSFDQALAAAQERGGLRTAVRRPSPAGQSDAIEWCSRTFGEDAIISEFSFNPSGDWLADHYHYYHSRVWTYFAHTFYFDDPDNAALFAILHLA